MAGSNREFRLAIYKYSCKTMNTGCYSVFLQKTKIIVVYIVLLKTESLDNEIKELWLA